ncbi:MAG: ATP-binding protein [Deltaproteobacteria bacterium]|nr:ATP-binding protein [Deltaproteobacteria bacterium]
MYTRSLRAPNRSFFLFGPRGTGKTTWLLQHFKEAKFIDLLPPQQALAYEKNPSLLRAQVKALPKMQWIVIDEIQKVPILLDEIHFLMEREGYKKFILTGSSARKIKRGQANLLAGRAVLLKMLPLTSTEINFSLEPQTALSYGMLPLSVLSKSVSEKESFLKAYVDTYLREEIKYEGIVRNLGSFSRFLEIASLCAGQQINMSNLARDAEISRDTVRSYFSVFEDTLLGSWLPAYRPRAKVKEVAAPKFYWFDSGVLNATAGAFEQPMPADWNGILMEHWIHHELVGHMTYGHKKGSLGFWKTPNGNEIDFLWWYGNEFIAIEVKSSKKFKKEFLKGIHSFQEKKQLKSSWVVYLGEEELRIDQTHVVPAPQFLKLLSEGKIIP